MRRKQVYLPVKLITKANDENWLRSLGYYTLLKAVYKDGVFYNFSYGKVAKLIGKSPATLLYHIRVLQGVGMVRFHNGNLTLLGNEKLKAFAGCKRLVAVPVDTKQQFDILRSQIIRFNLAQQAYHIRRTEKNNCTKAKSYISPTKLSENYVGLGTRKIGRLLNRSKMTGSRIRRKLEGMGILACYRVYEIVLKRCRLQDFRNLRTKGFIPPFYFYRDGQVLKPKHFAIQYIKGQRLGAKGVNIN